MSKNRYGIPYRFIFLGKETEEIKLLNIPT